MKILRLFFLLLSVYIFQVTIASRFTIFTVKPDLLLIVITLFAVSQGVERGFSAGIIGGLLQDLIGGVFFINSLTKGVLGFLVGTFKESIFGSEETVAVTAVLVATVTEFVLQCVLLLFFFDKPLASPLALLSMLILSCAYNCVLAPVLYPFIRALVPVIITE
jgi:rod shape-determining protein MreD